MSDDPDAARVRRRLLDGHGEDLAAVLDCADAVAADWGDAVDGRPATADRDAVVDPLRDELADSGLLAALTSALETAVDAAGADLQATPVPAPPYVVVTATGPVLRATLPDRRLVVSVECFRVERGDVTQYVRAGDDPEAALSVAFR